MASKKKTDQLSNNNLLIVLSLVSLLAVGGTVIVGKAILTGIIRDTKVLTAQSTANKNLDSDLNAAPQLVDQFNGLGSTAATLANALPNTADFSGLLVEMEGMTGDAGITLKSMAPSQVAAIDLTTPAASSGSATTPTPQEVDFSATVTGNYGSLQKLFADFEKSARPIRVTGVQLSGSGSQLNAELSLATYYQDKAQLPFSKETIK